MLKEYQAQVRKFVATLYKSFNEHRGLHKAELPFKFWDVVVLTASDDNQKIAYDMQINKKMHDNELIKGVDYFVFADPAGPKLGCGGATMNVIFELKKIYADDLLKLHVLVINAGGFSQRLPSSSALGKIFMALPYGLPLWSLFDLKLASYIPLLQRMQPGIFHAASDTIELFCVEESSGSEDWNFYKSGMTAVAHPSSVEVGVTHGVFVVGDETNCKTANARFVGCREVLQKPTLETLQEKQAIIKMDPNDPTVNDFVYTDSCFFIDHEFATKLFDFYVKEMPLTCEIDGYGDFMRCLGPNSNLDFAGDFRNVATVAPSLRPTREKLFDRLHSSNLNVIAFDDSEFFHLGTANEYLQHFGQNSSLAKLIGWNQKSFSEVTENSEISNNSTLLHSLFENKVKIDASAVIEYCHFACFVEIKDRCIVSNCSATGLPPGENLIIPANMFLHTVPIADGETTGYATIAFDVDDDVKRKFQSPADVAYLRRPLKTRTDLGVPFEDEITLWKARLFACQPDPTSSLLASLKFASDFLEGRPLDGSLKRYSACEVMERKDVKSMLKYRDLLKIEILKHSKSYSPFGSVDCDAKY